MVSSRDMLTGRKGAFRNLGRVLVLGLGKSGKAAARYCADLLGARVEELFVAAGARTDDAVAFVGGLPVSAEHVRFGDDAVEALAACADGRFDLCIASPGIPSFAPLYTAGTKMSAEVIGEVEFAWRESRLESRWVAVTGTNGKTTATALTAHLLVEAGVRARAVGNIGDTCLEAVAADDVDVYVAEVSSYQLASLARFAPNAAVVLNITPDHLHWHRTFEAYRDAKLRLLANLGAVEEGVAVLGATDEVVRAEVRRLRALDVSERGFAYVPVGTKAGLSGDMRAACGSENAAFVDERGGLHVALKGTDYLLGNASGLQVKGDHNVGNALSAAACALALGAEPARVSAALRTFAPLEHRVEPCGKVAGVSFVNDSKATNVDAAVHALSSFAPARPVVLLGGDDKGTDLAALVESAHAHARVVVCFGGARDRFSAAFAAACSEAPPDFQVEEAASLAEAFERAVSLARPGDTVLLSPASASFDEFPSFAARGDAFKALVSALRARTGA